MKMRKLLLFGMLVLAPGLAHAATKQPVALGNAQVFTITLSSNVQSNISTSTSISPSASYLVIESTGNQVTYATNSNIAAISTTTAFNGQYLVLTSTSATSTVVISTSASTCVTGDDSLIVITSTKSAPAFIYNGTLSQWMEVQRQ